MTTERLTREIDPSPAVAAAIEGYLAMKTNSGDLEKRPDRWSWAGYMCVHCDRIGATAAELAWDAIQNQLWASWNTRRNEAQLPAISESGDGDAPRRLRLVWSRD